MNVQRHKSRTWALFCLTAVQKCGYSLTESSEKHKFNEAKWEEINPNPMSTSTVTAIVHRKLDYWESDLQTPEGTMTEAIVSKGWSKNANNINSLKTSPVLVGLD